MNMDYHKKKLLSQSVSFLQGHLTLTSEFLGDLKDAGVLTREEVTIVQKDETLSGKVLELICLLKRKDSRSYTRFLQMLDKHNLSHVSAVLRMKASLSDATLPDPRTLQYLEHELANSDINAKLLRDLAVGLVLREIYTDDVTALEAKLTNAQKNLKGKFLRDPSSLSNDEGYATPKHLAVQETPRWDVPTKAEELQEVIREKDVIIRRKDDEYSKLKHILDDTQNDLQSLLDLNNQYLSIISQLNSMQINVGGGKKDDSRQIAELNKKLEQSQEKISELTHERDYIQGELGTTKREVDQLNKRQIKYKEMLGLAGDADEKQIHNRIKELLEQGTMQKQELDKICKELKKATAAKGSLEDKIGSLCREKEKVEFHLRQQDLTLKRMKRMKSANSTIAHASQLISSHVQLSTVENSGQQLNLISKNLARQTSGDQRYCIFCRSEYQCSKPSNCRLHFAPIRNGIWTCCKDECHRSSGCLHVPHFFIQVTVDRKVFLTDGARYMEIT